MTDWRVTIETIASEHHPTVFIHFKSSVFSSSRRLALASGSSMFLLQMLVHVTRNSLGKKQVKEGAKAKIKKIRIDFVSLCV